MFHCTVYKVGYQDSQEKCCNPLAAIKVTREWFFVRLRSVSTYNIATRRVHCPGTVSPCSILLTSIKNGFY